VQGAPTKGACQWINFYRNVNLTADGGAGGYIYHVLMAGTGTIIDIPGFPADAVGLVFRYYLYNVQQGVTDPTELAALYAQGSTNPATLQVAGTLAPLMPGETILTGPVGRLMVSNTSQIPSPPGTMNNAGGGLIALAPAVLQQNGNMLSADFLGTFPDWYKGPNSNPKYNFGSVELWVTGGGKAVNIAPVQYTDAGAGNALGWVFDFDISQNTAVQQALQDPEAFFTLVSENYGTVLAETDYYFPSNQQGVYLEQHGPGDQFLNQGTTEPATVSVYHRGVELDAASCPPITVWAYQSTPIQSPGNAFVVTTNFKPGDPLMADTSQPGNLLFTFTIGSGPQPPQNYAAFSNPPWITNAPSISVRILPNEDYSKYYVDPSAADPVGNDQLTWDVLYAEVLRTYYLLYPAMNKYIQLNSEQAITANAGSILYVTEMSNWMTSGYMPRTRDMSASRKQLLRAWCQKVSAPQPAGAAKNS
jgi:hypothetical protein